MDILTAPRRELAGRLMRAYYAAAGRGEAIFEHQVVALERDSNLRYAGWRVV